jgi:hypothetical protein
MTAREIETVSAIFMIALITIAWGGMFWVAVSAIRSWL